jgi:hypothetical protein
LIVVSGAEIEKTTHHQFNFDLEHFEHNDNLKNNNIVIIFGIIFVFHFFIDVFARCFSFCLQESSRLTLRSHNARPSRKAKKVAEIQLSKIVDSDEEAGNRFKIV